MSSRLSTSSTKHSSQNRPALHNEQASLLDFWPMNLPQELVLYFPKNYKVYICYFLFASAL
jgi:hypothetical protein